MKLTAIVEVILLLVSTSHGGPCPENIMARVNKVLKDYPIIDGHNDFPMGVRDLLNNDVSLLNFDHDLTKEEPWASYYFNHVDIPRMRKGKMGGQFWSAYISCSSQYKDATQKFLEQIDVIHQIVDKYPEDLMWADSAADIELAFSKGKVASLVGVESGHAIGSSMSILRTLYSMGARYMTLTHGCNTPWADAAQVEDGSFPSRVNGLSDFGVKIVQEMNRLGMLVDLSHVSSDAMRQAIQASFAPVIFSHSSARAVAAHSRNVPDDVLEMVKENGGIVMVNFYTCFLVESCRTQNATVLDVVKHINHIRKIAGVDHVGIGGDYNGIDVTPVDLPDVSYYPNVFAALIEDTEFEWTDEDLGKLASGNLIRVLKEVEEVRDLLAIEGQKPDNTWISSADLGDDTACNSK
jgi:membrane dipeptidase